MKLALLLLALAIASPGWAQEENAAGRDQARSMVITKFGIVAASQTLASQAGARVLEEGGNAIDAAIATNAVLGVTESAMNGMGGDLFAIVYDAKTGKLYGLNSSGWAPAALTTELLRSKGITDMNSSGAHRVTVPGAVAGWQALHDKFGTMKFDKLLAPAIYYAENGYPVTEIIGKEWAAQEKSKAKVPGWSETYMPGGHVPKVGEMFRNPALAASLKLVAEKGRDGFYKGPLAGRLVSFLKEQGNMMSLEDLAEFQPEWVEPISTTYRGWRVYEIPPNTQGIAALEMLNIMEKYPVAEYGHNSVKALHAMIEAKKLAYADMLRYIGDPRFGKQPVAQLTSKDFAAERAKLIDSSHANCDALPAELADRTTNGNDTIYMSAVDSDGQHRFADPEQLQRVRDRTGGAGNGIRSAKSRRAVHAEAGPAEYARAAQASSAHDDSRVHGKGFDADRVRDHGRMEPGAGARAVRVEHRRLRDEYSDGHGSRSIHQGKLRRMRRA